MEERFRDRNEMGQYKIKLEIDKEDVYDYEKLSSD